MITTTLILFSIMILGSFLSWPMYLTLSLGILPFYLLALSKGHSLKTLITYSKLGFASLKKTYLLLFLIGATTALWNDSGTLTGLVSLCLTFLTPYNFLLLTFLVTWLVTLLLGSALGTAGTIGVLFISIAESHGYSLAMTGGAIVSAIYIGERTSPVSTCANLVAEVNRIKVFDYIRQNFKSIFPIVMMNLVIYSLLSLAFPIALSSGVGNFSIFHSADKIILGVLPILVLIGMILLQKNVIRALLVSMGVSVISLLLIEHLPLTQMLYHMMFGSSVPVNGISVSSKGLIGMFPTVLVVMISAVYGGLFEGSGIFDPLKLKLIQLSQHSNLYITTVVTSLLGAAIGCSQTFSVIFTHHLLHQSYTKEKHPNMANDLADTAVLLPALVPWNIAAAVPALLLGTGYSYMPFAFMIYLPACLGLFKANKTASQKHLQGCC